MIKNICSAIAYLGFFSLNAVWATRNSDKALFAISELGIKSAAQRIDFHARIREPGKIIAISALRAVGTFIVGTVRVSFGDV